MYAKSIRKVEGAMLTAYLVGVWCACDEDLNRRVRGDKHGFTTLRWWTSEVTTIRNSWLCGVWDSIRYMQSDN